MQTNATTKYIGAALRIDWERRHPVVSSLVRPLCRHANRCASVWRSMFWGGE